MIRDLSLTLQAILDDPALAVAFPELLGAQVAFDRPADTFNPSVATIDLFLFNLRENMELRSNEPLTTLTDGQFSIKRPPARISCSYLVTAWPAGGGELPLQEHRLLSQALQVLARYPLIPASFLRGQLIGQTPSLPMMTAQAEGFSSPHEFWAAIGNKMRASFMVTVTIGMEVFPEVITAPEVIVSGLRVDRRASPDGEGLVPGAAPGRFRIGGRVTDSASLPVADASVRIVELGLAARTDADGRYQIGVMPAGSYGLHIEKGSAVANVAVTVPPAALSAYDVEL
jgi:hypothetical protein